MINFFKNLIILFAIFLISYKTIEYFNKKKAIRIISANYEVEKENKEQIIKENEEKIRKELIRLSNSFNQALAEDIKKNPEANVRNFYLQNEKYSSESINQFRTLCEKMGWEFISLNEYESHITIQIRKK